MGTAVGVTTMYLSPLAGGLVNLGTAAETGVAWIETKALDFDKPEFVKELEGILSNIDGRQTNDSVRLEIWGSDDEEGTYELLDTIWLSEAEDEMDWTDPPGKRFFKLKFADDYVNNRWRIHGFEVYGDYGGEEWGW